MLVDFRFGKKLDMAGSGERCVRVHTFPVRDRLLWGKSATLFSSGRDPRVSFNIRLAEALRFNTLICSTDLSIVLHEM
jgi:hypothetical protein